jgi:tetratricopeptide (TPR) repeat protein
MFLLAGMLGVSSFPCVLLSSAQAKAPVSQLFDQLAAQADQARDTNDLEKALLLYRKALGMRPGWAEGWWSLGTILYDRNNYADAARAFQRVVALQPQHGSARVMLGLCEFELGRDDFALRDIEKGKQLGVLNDPQLHRVMLYHEGVLLLRKGAFEGAQQALDLLNQDGVEDKEFVLGLGMSVLRIYPANLPPEGSTAREIVLRAGKAQSLAALKKFDEARVEYSGLADEYPDTANIHYAFGRFLLEIYDIDAAVGEFHHEIQNNPEHVLARLEIAAVRYRLDSADGLKYAEEAVKLAPGLPFAHYLLGLLRLDTGDAADAIPELEIAQTAFPMEARIYFSLGNAYARAGRKAEAAKARAEFARLNAQAAKEPGSNVYGEQPSVLSEGQLRIIDRGKPPQ